MEPGYRQPLAQRSCSQGKRACRSGICHTCLRRYNVSTVGRGFNVLYNKIENFNNMFCKNSNKRDEISNFSAHSGIMSRLKQ